MTAPMNILIMLPVQQALLLVIIFPSIARLCFAQSTFTLSPSDSSDPTSTASSEIQIHTISVGKVVESSIFAILKGKTG